MEFISLKRGKNKPSATEVIAGPITEFLKKVTAQPQI